MTHTPRVWVHCVVLVAFLAHGAAGLAQTPPVEAGSLPGDRATNHSLELPGRTLRFTATAGAIRLPDDQGKPLAELAFVAYQVDGADRVRRPVTFVFNGGPGFASAWLNVGAVGPWRIAMGGDARSPSASPEPLPNAETWLDFSDLVFIDPAGTGHSRVLGSGDDVRRRLFSVDGDVGYLAAAMRRWLDRFDRGVSPKYILGESYGGFRAPRLARELATRQGTGITGLILVSPALEIVRGGSAFDPFAYVSRLPSMAAAARAAGGPVTRDRLADVERYAASDYLVELTRGARDPDAVSRRSARVAEFTGLDPVLVRRHGGMLDTEVFLHELDRAQSRVASGYDATASIADPYPWETASDVPDPVLEALKAPVSSAMVAVYQTQLNWRPETPYRLFNGEVNRQWEWGRGGRPQSVAALREALALDPRLTVLIACGMFDLVTPYFGTQLLIDQIPPVAGGDRVRLAAYPGGHMFYSDDASRAAWREAARAMFERP